MAAYEKAEQERKANEEKARQDKAVEYWTQKYDKELPDAIKAAGLPLTQEVITSAADVLIGLLE